MTTIQFEVLPDDADGWNVTRDRVVTAGFDQKQRAERHALACCLTASLSGTAARLTVVGRDGQLQQQRSFAPRPSTARPSTSRPARPSPARTERMH